MAVSKSERRPRSPIEVQRIGVVVPARDEARLIGDCLEALDAAAAAVPVPVVVCAVLDDCRDETPVLVARAAARLPLDLRVRPCAARSVGVARKMGMAHLLTVLGTEGTWLATTDADSVVPRDWLVGQRRHAESGANVVVGTVRISDWSAWPESVRATAQRAYRSHSDAGPRRAHRHVHGANLAVRADSYVRVGGFAPVDGDEDVRLVEALVEAGEPVAWVGDLAVTTSARRAGRVPAGFAGYLDDLASGMSRARPAAWA